MKFIFPVSACKLDYVDNDCCRDNTKRFYGDDLLPRVYQPHDMIPKVIADTLLSIWPHGICCYYLGWECRFMPGLTEVIHMPLLISDRPHFVPHWNWLWLYQCLFDPLRPKRLNLETFFEKNKANLRDLIAATGLVISNWIKIVNFSARVTVKFDGWPCKTIGHLFYATSSFVHLFVPIGEFKLKLQSGNAQPGSNWMIFRAVRPWNLTDDLAKQ